MMKLIKRKPTFSEAELFCLFDEESRLGFFEMYKRDWELLFEKRFSAFFGNVFSKEYFYELFHAYRRMVKYNQGTFVRSDFFERNRLEMATADKDDWPYFYYKTTEFELPE